MSASPITPAQSERFQRLAWPLLPVVLRTAHCLTGRTDRAEDLAQETMVKAMRAIDSYRDGTDMKSWLLTILRRTHIDRLRADRRRPKEIVLSDEVAEYAGRNATPAGRFDDAWEEPEELMNRFEDEALIDALRSLPEDIRWTLLLADVEQLDHADVASVLGVAVGTIKSRCHRGRAMLRDRLYPLAAQRGWFYAHKGSS